MRTIVVVEDEPLIRLAVEDQLTELGFSVLAFENSLEAVACIHGLESPPCCVISDLRLPGVSGWQLARAARQSFPDVPVLYITGGTTADRSFEAVENCAYLRKPFSPKAFRQIIERLTSGTKCSGGAHLVPSHGASIEAQ